MQNEFLTKLEQISQKKKTDLMLMLNPQLVKMPLPMKRHDDPFFPFGKAIIQATSDLVIGYMFDMASYLRLGAAGAIALERTLSYAIGDNLLILHGPFATSDFAEISDENAFIVDAVTLTEEQDPGPYLVRQDRGVFMLSERDPQSVDMPERGGIYRYAANQLAVFDSDGKMISLRVIGEEALYADASDEYTQHTREALEVLREG